MNQLHDYLGFLDERIRRGAMLLAALSRAASIVRQLPPEHRAVFVGLRGGALSPAPKRGPLRPAVVRLSIANAYVAQWHRYLPPVVGHKFSVSVSDGYGIRGVAIVGRPVARHLDDGATLEVLRVATDGTRNACSALLGTVRRQVIAGNRVGRWYVRKLVTYTLPHESGASLRAAGWHCDGPAGGGSWSRLGRRRRGWIPTVAKTRWSIQLTIM